MERALLEDALDEASPSANFVPRFLWLGDQALLSEFAQQLPRGGVSHGREHRGTPTKTKRRNEEERNKFHIHRF